MLVLLFALVLLLVLFIVHVRKMAPFYVLSSKIPGPYALPVIGSAWKFIAKSPEEIMQTIVNITKDYPSPMKFWLGTKFLLVICDPENARIILSSNRMNKKGDDYRFMEPLLGGGLITASGARWKKHRKLIQPLLDITFLKRILNLFDDFSEDFISTLDNMKGVFDVQDIVQVYVADVLALAMLGYDTKTRNGKNREFLKAPKRFYQVVSHRICKPWLQPKMFFKCTNLCHIQKDVIQAMDRVILEAIQNAKKRLRENGINDGSPLIDKLLSVVEQNPDLMTEQELSYHLKTLFIASEDTVVNISSFTLVCLGMAVYLKHQERISEEIKLLPSNVVITSPPALPYLTKCIKEVLRLFPAGPQLFRKTVDHFQLDNLILPPHCTILINIWGLHHDPKQWERPTEFYPEHFNNEAIARRHPCSFLPFSMGLRACAGKTLVYPWLKLILVKILERYHVETKEELSTLKLISDVTVRAKDGYNIRLIRKS